MTIVRKHLLRVSIATVLMLTAGRFVLGQNLTHITRVEVRAGPNTLTQDIAHGPPAFDFRGEKPVLRVLSGENQTKVSGYLPQSITIAVFHADGSTPWPFAPVTLSVEYGKGGWAATQGGAVSAILTVSANGSGIAHAVYWMP